MMYDVCGLVEVWYHMEFLRHPKPEAVLKFPGTERFFG